MIVVLPSFLGKEKSDNILLPSNNKVLKATAKVSLNWKRKCSGTR